MGDYAEDLIRPSLFIFCCCRHLLIHGVRLVCLFPFVIPTHANTRKATRRLLIGPHSIIPRVPPSSPCLSFLCSDQQRLREVLKGAAFFFSSSPHHWNHSGYSQFHSVVIVLILDRFLIDLVEIFCFVFCSGFTLLLMFLGG